MGTNEYLQYIKPAKGGFASPARPTAAPYNINNGYRPSTHLAGPRPMYNSAGQPIMARTLASTSAPVAPHHTSGRRGLWRRSRCGPAYRRGLRAREGRRQGHAGTPCGSDRRRGGCCWRYQGEDVVDGFAKGITLMPHQVRGTQWMKSRETGRKYGGILADVSRTTVLSCWLNRLMA